MKVISYKCFGQIKNVNRTKIYNWLDYETL